MGCTDGQAPRVSARVLHRLAAPRGPDATARRAGLASTPIDIGSEVQAMPRVHEFNQSRRNTEIYAA